MEVSRVENGCEGISRSSGLGDSRVKLPTGPDSVRLAEGSIEHSAGPEDRYRFEGRIEGLVLWSVTVSRTNWVE